MKPYFLPLKAEPYERIEAGLQMSEIRPNNHRGWNHSNIFPGRILNLSYGYGKKRRMLKTVTNIIITRNLEEEKNITGEHIKLVYKIYGKRYEWLVARFD